MRSCTRSAGGGYPRYSGARRTFVVLGRHAMAERFLRRYGFLQIYDAGPSRAKKGWCRIPRAFANSDCIDGGGINKNHRAFDLVALLAATPDALAAAKDKAESGQPRDYRRRGLNGCVRIKTTDMRSAI